ncbi:type I glyceraldehyde-3-phosphate dehydrogenase [Helicobacter bizzozeronii]|uniref:type I glyceraldehyde-3-phosphate dehydrogenase n=1 Tax=Helicobacter bizzozeronii TaxID=56877 RepID=UPI000CF0D5A9|nr:glyceraldehyde 3-phosphate dehydrogenase NAD-binding domain-containing protein [Helicobacter bizzozeronii]
MKIAINGFGRIGRCVARILLAEHPECLVKINDVGDWEMLAYLFQHDSVHGIYSQDVELGKSKLVVGDHILEITQSADPQDLDLSGIDVLLETSGKFSNIPALEVFRERGAKKIILGAPFENVDPNNPATFVLGVNHHLYDNQPIISNASCTTNALAPICMLLDEHFGIKSALLTTIHSYTQGQALVDGIGSTDKRRCRAAHNIIPTTTRSAQALHLVLPQLKDKMHGRSVRVPTMDVSMIDLSARLGRSISTETLIGVFRQASQERLLNILEMDSHYKVSADIIGNCASCVVIEDMAFSLGQHAKIMAWYDNEWAYAKRLVEMAFYIH